MTPDGLSIAASVRELAALRGAKIEKITQPAADVILLQLHSDEGKQRLLLSANPGDCRLHLTQKNRQSPQLAPRFCMVLRKYLASGRVAAIEQLGLERIVTISIDAKDELGAYRGAKLICEIMGKYSNIILTAQDGRVLDSIKRVPPDMSSVRSVLPGVTYEPPPLSKANPLNVSKESLADMLSVRSDIEKRILDTVEGISAQTAHELVFRRFGNNAPEVLSENQRAKLAAEIKDFANEAVNEPKPVLQLDMTGKPVFYSVLPYESYAGAKAVSCDSMNDALDRYYTLREDMAALEEKRRQTLKQLKKHITRVQKKLKIQRETLMEASHAEDVRIKGELLTANLYRCPRGAKSLEVDNYYDGSKLMIPLDSALSPSVNAQRFYKKYEKLQNARSIAARQAEEYDAELTYLEELEYTVQRAVSVEDIGEVRLDMQKYGYVEPPKGKPQPRKDPLADPLEFRSSGGFVILAGRNSRQNDALTLKAAAQDDIWFHAKGVPGSHVILVTSGREPGEKDIYEAAVIAAKNSKAASAGRAEVDYCPRKNVWKARGARPGMVLYEGQHSILVDC